MDPVIGMVSPSAPQIDATLPQVGIGPTLNESTSRPRLSASKINQYFTKNCLTFNATPNPRLAIISHSVRSEDDARDSLKASGRSTFIVYSSVESSVKELHRRAKLCRRLANGAVPLRVAQELTAFARDYEGEAVRLERQRHAA